MRFAYLILAHRDMEQLHALITRLLRDDPEDLVIVHYDRGSPVSDEELARFAQGFGGAVTLTPRVRCLWGHHSQVRAELILKQALSGLDYDYAHMISGQDWPACSKTEMVQSLEPGTCYLTFESPPLTERMDDYHLHDWMQGPKAHSTSARYHLQMFLRRAGRAWTRLAGARTCPFGPEWKKGSAWWSLPKAAVTHAAEQIDQLVRSGRLHHTVCADEHVVHTVLHYSPFAQRLAENRRFIKWRPGTSNPEVLKAEDRAAIEASGDWFARKMDRAVDPFFLTL